MFGMGIRSADPLPGLDRRDGGSADELVLRGTRSPIDFPDYGATRIVRKTAPGGATAATIDSHPEAGYLLEARGIARCRLDGEARELTYSTAGGIDWMRYLLGHVLPFASTLRGNELFHASAVEHDGGAYAFVGESGAGKSTVALGSCLRGAGFLSDDVVAVTTRAGVPLAHPGSRIAKVRHSALDLIELERLPEPYAEAEDSTLVQLTGPGACLPLRALFFLVPSRSRASVEIAAVAAPVGRRILESTFDFVQAGAGRLLNQLEVAAAIAARAELFEVRIPARPDRSVVDAIWERIAGAQAPGTHFVPKAENGFKAEARAGNVANRGRAGHGFASSGRR